jgi:hypothetical protein
MRRSWFLLLASGPVVGLLAVSLAGCGPHPSARPAPGPATGTAKPSKTAQEAPGTYEPPAPTVAPGGAASRPGYERRVEALKGIGRPRSPGAASCSIPGTAGASGLDRSPGG